jgi:hypothetical protein
VKPWGDTTGLSAAELGYTPVDEPISPREFRGRVEQAMVDAFGSKVDMEPDKHIGVAAGTGTLDADVVPCFEMHRFDAPKRSVVGHRIYPKSGGTVDNFPQQNYDNGVAKNRATGRRYKELVRCMKRLITELHEGGKIPRDYPGYLTESLIYNVPNDRFAHTRRYDDMQAAFRFLWSGLKEAAIYNERTERAHHALPRALEPQPEQRPQHHRQSVG